MIKAYKIFTGADGHSHVVEGTVLEDHLSNASSIRFKETPAHSSYDWHPAPTIQYVITLSGTLKFTMHSGKTFTIKTGDILIAMDTSGSGHKWQLTDDQPWKRAYVTFGDNREINFKEND
ncbi:MAG TPA: hypothetical protein VF623_02240 [Segetibacter sp.]